MKFNNTKQFNTSPIIDGEEVIFIYRGNAESVYLVGDYNRWEREDKMTRLDNSDVWSVKKVFPINARFDYKYVVDGNWITDPLNNHTSQVGAGVNSTLVMPGYKSDYEQIIAETSASGSLLMDRKLVSLHMGKEMIYHVYQPPCIKDGEVNHILYALDGSEYVSYAKINIVLSYMIAHELIPKMVVVLIDPDDRNRDYTIYEPYFRYVTEELMPFVENEYMNDSFDRSVMGVSWGGLTAFYLAFNKPCTFQKLLTQSGSYWPQDYQIFNIVNEAAYHPLKICVQTGTIQDTEEMNDAMVQLLTAKGYTVTYNKYAETHSWSNWKGHLSEGLRNLFSIRPINS